MTLPVPVCTSCGRPVFPRRLLCPQCGGSEFRDEPVEAGVLEAVSEREVRVGTVRTALGPVAIARVETDARPGDEVPLDADGEVPVVRTTDGDAG